MLIKYLTKFNTLSYSKVLNKLRIKGNYLNIIEPYVKKIPQLISHSMVENEKVFL